MHNDLKMTLEYVDELGRLKLANALAEVANIGPQAPGHSGRSGGSQRGGCRGSVQAGHGYMTEDGYTACVAYDGYTYYLGATYDGEGPRFQWICL